MTDESYYERVRKGCSGVSACIGIDWLKSDRGHVYMRGNIALKRYTVLYAQAVMGCFYLGSTLPPQPEVSQRGAGHSDILYIDIQ
jgi:hypothetical protein